MSIVYPKTENQFAAFPKPKTRFWRQYPVLQTLVTYVMQ